MSFVGSILRRAGILGKQDVHESEGVALTNKAGCPYCNANFSGTYKWNGMVVSCPSCGSPVVLQRLYSQARGEGGSGYAITYRDFLSLVRNEDSTADQVRILIGELLSCEVKRENGRFFIVDRDSSLVPMEVAHFEIQADARKQYELYQAAMNIWR